MMDKPQYTNAFTVSYNKDLKEVVITFAQEYPSPVFSTVDDNGGPVQAQITFSTTREDVSGVVMPAEVACQLITVIQRSMEAADEPASGQTTNG